MSTSQHHTVNGRKTAARDIVHYTDEQGAKHAARIEAVSGNEAHLHVFHGAGAAQDSHQESVPHSATGVAHSWTHFPE